MRRWLPYPALSFFILAVWLLLNQSVSAGAIILGSCLGVGASWGMSALQQPGLRVGRPDAALRLAGFVLWEIVRSNIAVARIILRPSRGRTAGFMSVKLDLVDPYALAVLSCILTATPGTLWVSYNSTSGMLLIHVLDLVDEDDWTRIVKSYEQRLTEIFE